MLLFMEGLGMCIKWTVDNLYSLHQSRCSLECGLLSGIRFPA